jgi:hypothetical protein
MNEKTVIQEGFSGDPFGGKGVLVIDRPDRRVWAMCEEVPGQPGKQRWTFNTQTLIGDLLDKNQNLYNDSEGRRFGDGQVIGRMPTQLYFSSGYNEARENKDEKWVKKFWNDADHRKLRTFKGNI